MWKYTNTALLLLCFSLGIAEATLFGDKLNFQLGLEDFLLAPMVFGVMVFTSTWFYKVLSKKSRWYVPTYNMNLFATDNPLKTPFMLGGSFIVLGLGWATGDLYQGGVLSNMSMMLFLSGTGVLVGGLISVKVFSCEKI